MVLMDNGKLYTFGSGSYGQLGQRSSKNYQKPALVKDFMDKPIAAIAAGWNHSLALTE